jgi:hypothetical protein
MIVDPHARTQKTNKLAASYPIVKGLVPADVGEEETFSFGVK